MDARSIEAEPMMKATKPKFNDGTKYLPPEVLGYEKCRNGRILNLFIQSIFLFAEYDVM